ncbi:protein NKG7-like [Clytia hemisphaerica]|uniref:Uncharacterized protein n=1 Tax=Clytia hemisphaerica TaxID=252671 RepID=A0A7M5WJK0_9CNID|eukprot:TCONS_00071697-protein
MNQQTQYRIFILLFVIFGSISLLMSVCGKYWIKTTDLYSGLWEMCFHDVSHCKEVDTAKQYWIPLVRGFMIAGLSLFGLALLFFICLISSPKAFNSSVLSFIIGAGVCASVVGMSIYTQYNSDTTNSYNYHWAYWLGWFGNVLMCCATGMAIHDARRPASPYAEAERLR